MKFLKHLLLATILCATISGCHTRQKVVYLQGSDSNEAVSTTARYSARIKKDDQLLIIVNSQNPELAAPFNMQLSQKAFTAAGGQVSLGASGGSPQVFWVDENGDIAYPMMDHKLHVEGMTRSQLADTIQSFLITNGYISDPIVTVTFNNFRISVIGEVTRPGQFNITTDRVSILDAIAMAGDLTIFGERDKVRIYREEDGKVSTLSVDLRDPQLATSPYYYLHQNDIVYVEPNNAKASNREIGTLYTFAISLASLALTIATFIRTFD